MIEQLTPLCTYWQLSPTIDQHTGKPAGYLLSIYGPSWNVAYQLRGDTVEELIEQGVSVLRSNPQTTKASVRPVKKAAPTPTAKVKMMKRR